MHPGSPQNKQGAISSYWSLGARSIFEKTQSGPKGLATEESSGRLKLLPGKKERPAWQKEMALFFRQFKSPLVLMLVAAVILSTVIGEHSDAIIILFILLATGLLSFFQERNAGRTVEKLQAMIAVKNKVIRDEKEFEIPGRDIVRGDLLIINAGDIVPADCYVLESNELHANEASLTGESFPVRKGPGIVEENTVLAKRFNCLWEGSSIVSGTGKAIAVNTGEQTIFGDIAKSASDVTETTFEKGIRHFGFFLLQVTLVLAIVILAINLLSHKPLVESLLFALALAVGMAPELLPAINTIAMSAGAKRMLEKKVIVKKLSAIQNLGEVNLLCADKTGTITQGIIRIADSFDASGKKDASIQELACINARFESGYANPIDEALKKLPVTLPAHCTKTGEIPYDFLRKRLTIAVTWNDKLLIVSKGALTNILETCTLVKIAEGKNEPIQSWRENIVQLYKQYGQDGFRVLGVCYKEVSPASISKDDETEMIFAGFVLLHDPVKEGLKDALESMKKLQVGVKIITGDNRIVAESIGKKIGLQQPVVLSGEELQQTSSEALILKAQHTDIFAEVEPHQKERIIQALRKNYTVAYMGDGINDVAAINAADVGISIDNAVDVAKSAADFVLLEQDLAVLADGIREGRKTFSNTLKYIFINTGATFGNMFSVAFASLMLPFLPMLPFQILLTNFLSGLPFLAISIDNVDKEMLERSSKWDIRLIRLYMIVFGLHSSIFDILTFVTLYFVLKVSEGTFQTGWFFESVLTELFILFIMRTRKPFLKSRPSRLLLWLSLAALLVTFVLIYLPPASMPGMTPLKPILLFSMLLIVLAYVFTGDALKVWFFKRMAKRGR